jgi:integrase
MAQRTLELMRTIYNWAIEEERIEHNPACASAAPAGGRRARPCSLRARNPRCVWKSLDQQPFSVAARLLQLLTAQRSGEIRRIRWADIDLETGWWTIPAEFSKNKLSHRVPLSPWASQILRDAKAEFGAGEWLFPGREPALPVPESWRPLRLVREASGVHFWMHDLRRTAASSMTSIGLGQNWSRRS